VSKVLVLYYSSYGHIEQMAEAIAAGVREAGSSVDIKRVPETVPDDVAKNAGYKLNQVARVATIAELEAGSTPRKTHVARLGMTSFFRRDRGFESPSLQRGVCCEPHSGSPRPRRGERGNRPYGAQYEHMHCRVAYGDGTSHWRRGPNT